jgi:7-cyano-7-deazaguanine synthase in queuosine biosynthesis
MRIDVDVHPTESTNSGFAKVVLECPDIGYMGLLDMGFLPLIPLQNQSTMSLDLLFLSAVVYSVDKIAARNHTIDAWTRQLKVNIPVENLEQWNSVKEVLQDCLSFLTGDHWTFNFAQLEVSLIRPRTNNPTPVVMNPSAVCLFSGGLDSLIGAIDWLEGNTGELVLASHYDGRAALPKSDQDIIFNMLHRNYGERLHKIQVRAGQNPSGKETTFRSRSFLFLAIGIYIASAYHPDIPLFMPENATIGINVPLTPSRRGSCSTRTTHPNFMRQYCALIRGLGINNRVYNPLDFLTKGECVENCQNRRVLEETVMQSVSCGKRGHKRWWIRRDANGCGRCMPCIYRRAALHKIRLDTEPYGYDICNGEVPLDQDKALADDLRACVSFLAKNYNAEQVTTLLLANGTVNMEDLAAYSDVVVRAMNEIRNLIRDKATDNLQVFARL